MFATCFIASDQSSVLLLSFYIHLCLKLVFLLMSCSYFIWWFVFVNLNLLLVILLLLMSCLFSSFLHFCTSLLLLIKPGSWLKTWKIFCCKINIFWGDSLIDNFHKKKLFLSVKEVLSLFATDLHIYFIVVSFCFILRKPQLCPDNVGIIVKQKLVGTYQIKDLPWEVYIKRQGRNMFDISCWECVERVTP